MNPRTGEFHEVSHRETPIVSKVRGTAEELEALDKFRSRQKARLQLQKPEDRLPQDPRMEELFIKSTLQPVPASWPIFTVGDTLELTNEDFKFHVSLHEVTRKDLITLLVEGTSDIPSNPVGLVFLVNGYSFRVRKAGRFPVVIDGLTKVRPTFALRPVLGTPRNYIKRNG